jgi:crotonobetainyl-CoA:carnitine CoA-transferase CaiB-like acyl-CoA transferase
MVRGQSVYFSVYNRGKKSVCIDLRRPEGKEVFGALVTKSDIVLENFRPGVMKAMGFEYERLRALNPSIILVSVSGFGQYGPYRDRPAFDSLGQAMGGLMALTGQQEGHPIGTATSLVDRYTSLHATIGALAALRHRERTGEGQLVDVCLLDSALTMVEIPTSYYLATGEEGGEGGRPPYRARDGWVVIAAAGREMAATLMKMVGGPADDTPLAGSAPAADRRAKIEAWCAQRTTDEICAALHEAGIPCAPVRTIPEVAKDPHLWEREMLVKMKDPIAGEMYVPGATIKLSRTPARVGMVPTPGQHTNEVLSEILGYDAAKLSALRATKAIG